MKKAAQAISAILHPFILFDIGIILFIGEHFNWQIEKLLSWGLFLVVINSVLVAFIIWGMKTRRFSNFDVSKRKQRFLLYQVVIILALAFYFIGKAIGVSEVILKSCMVFIIFLILLEVINTKVKSSVHIASITIVSVTLAFFYRGIFMVLPFCIPVLAWARIYEKRHTPKEVFAGFIVGLLILIIANFIIR